MRLRVCQALLLNYDTRTATLANEYVSTVESQQDTHDAAGIVNVYDGRVGEAVNE